MPLTLAKIKAGIRQLTIGSKALISAIVTGTSLMQIQEARDFVIMHASAHPRVVSLAGGVCAILIVLHNPKVQKFLHIEQETTGTDAAGQPQITNTEITSKVG